MLEGMPQIGASPALKNGKMEKQPPSPQDEITLLRQQLLESEKLASLGQLSAGIAHEIKNPLNFINNFAKLTRGLLDELTDILNPFQSALSPEDRSYLEEVLGDMRSNLEKIDEHGHRAESIISGMLLQARGRSGVLMPTDVNSLLAEYLNLAYHALRAQNSSFNIKMEASYDPAIGKINAVPQDLSRVFLNLINNACYATNEKKKLLGDAYAPVLSVSTHNEDEAVSILIRDNGTGIPDAVRDKLFTRFFTTKPAGEGTGLGLSISREIIENQHHGQLSLSTKEGEFTEFKIVIPKNLK